MLLKCLKPCVSFALIVTFSSCGKFNAPRCDGMYSDDVCQEFDTVSKTLDSAKDWGRNMAPSQKAEKIGELIDRMKSLQASRKYCRTERSGSAATWEVVCTDNWLNEKTNKSEHCEYLCDQCKQVQTRLLPLGAKFEYRKL